LALALASSSARAQGGCGSANPNCMVPTPPPGDASNRAAPTAWVLSGGVVLGGDITGLPGLTTVTKIQGTAISGTTGTGAAVLSASPIFTGTFGGVNGVLTGTFSVVGATTLSTTSVGTLNVGAAGMVGDGVTNNNTAFQTALTAATTASPGGKILIPCGAYKLTANMTASVPNNSVLTIAGSGKDCTTLAFSGAVNGISVTYNNANSVVDILDMSITTDQAGGVNGVSLTQTASGNTVNVVNELRNLNFHGYTLLTGGTTHYWANAISLNNISGINIDDVSINNGAKGQGNGTSIKGNSASSLFSIVTNFVNYTVTFCNAGIVYGDWVQGVQIANSNFTSCTDGILVPASQTANESELEVVNSQFGFNTFDINMLSFVDNLHLANDYFLVETGGSGIVTASSYYTIVGNSIFSSTGGLTAPPLHITNLGQSTHAGNVGTIEGNFFFNLAIGGMTIDLNAAPTVIGNQFTNVVTPITNNSVTAIIDANPGSGYVYPFASLPTCGALTNGLTLVADGAAGLAWGAILTTGSTPYRVFCDGTNWTVMGK
jgi:hypothetical protein